MTREKLQETTGQGCRRRRVVIWCWRFDRALRGYAGGEADRVDDATHGKLAAAVEEGIVFGGGVALLRAYAAICKPGRRECRMVQVGINDLRSGRLMR